ncbi:MAG TPA: tyrosine 2,3-aminomutase [Acidobacteriota bacterium]|nr:tyrosine 2,3-aminomutase [Acidobacteriota bacterium]
MKIKGENHSIYDVYQVAVCGEPVELEADQLEAVEETYLRVQEWGEAKHPIYGVNTGFGELVYVIVPPQYKTALQRNLILSHAAGGGEFFPDEYSRAIMMARLNCFIKGYSGVSRETVRLLQEFLNRGIHPLIPKQGSLGASGDLAPLSHVALALIGKGKVRTNGEIRNSEDVLRECGLRPLDPGFKEGLALINGTSAMTGVASLALVKAYSLLKQALLASAHFVQCLRGSTRPFESRGHELKNHYGQIAVAEHLRQLLTGSALTQEHGQLMESISRETAGRDDVVDTEIYLQNAYTLRCIPQVYGCVLDTFDYCRRLIEEEINSCNDNPLFFEVPEDTFHGGNFHGQYIAMCCDQLNIAVSEIGVMAERQLNRLLDPHINGSLPAFLAHDDSGLYCGFEGGQYLATSVASENLDLAAPASIKTIPSNGQNQDVVSMGLNSARKTLQICANVQTILAVLMAACNQASYFVEAEKFSRPVKQLNDALSQVVDQYRDSEPLAEHFARIREFLESESADRILGSAVDFEQSRANNRAWV